MTKRMLIDAAHPEETRVVVLNDGKLEELDVETSTKDQVKGNIYLCKVTRVEPSLQAAFVEFGGNRHGFLAFSEIHPDYFQIPTEDRAELASLTFNSDTDDDEPDAPASDEDESEVVSGHEEEAVDHSAMAAKRARLLRSYKIQEVIKRRQILLAQVVKEERGNKGAALTTYLSIAGRYCVLMPNTNRGGGISRKISNPDDRKRLKVIANELEVPEGMGLIIRTAGAQRNRAEIRRDYDYLLRLWSDIRERTLESVAPSLIHEEADLVKRAIRDIYTRDIEEVLVSGEESYKSVKRFMSMIMPSRARLVKQYKSDVPIFLADRVDEQLDTLHSPEVVLRSGGSLVIHTTEALTAIDVNSGKATRERHIEETAYKTNLEAADEVARQLRLRDVAGLVVIDFIDMSESRNQRAVERRLRDALKTDRARIQIGRISSFGLLELSRQRLRPSFQELSASVCPHCLGIGHVRSTEGLSLSALRRIEQFGVEGGAGKLTMTIHAAAAFYILNEKRHQLADLENRYDLKVEIVPGQAMSSFKIDRIVEDGKVEEVADTSQPVTNAPAASAPDEGEDKQKKKRRRKRKKPSQDNQPQTTPSAEGVEDADEAGAMMAEASEPADDVSTDEQSEDSPAPKRRRRRRGPRKNNKTAAVASETEASATEDHAESTVDPATVEQPFIEDNPNISILEALGVDDQTADDSDNAVMALPAIEEPEPKKPAPRRRRKKAQPSDEAVDKVLKALTGEEEANSLAAEDTTQKVIAEATPDASEEAVEASPAPVVTIESTADVPDEVAENNPTMVETAEPEATSEESVAANEPSQSAPAPTVIVEDSASVVVDNTVTADTASQAPKKKGWWSRFTSGA